MKRLLVLNYEWPPLGGGASPVSYELAKRLSETGEYDIDVVTMRYKKLPKYEEVNANLRIHRVWSLRTKKEMCYPWEQFTYLISGYLKCRKLIKQQGYDLCHTHFIIPTGVLAWVLKKQFSLPYIITSHGSDVLGYNNRFKWLYPLLVRPWKGILNSAKIIVSPSHFLKDRIQEVYKEFRSENIAVIPNGIDTKKFTPQKKKPYIFSSGRLFPNKGFQYLIQAVSYEDIGWEVHIAGDGPMLSELEQMAKKSKTKVVLHGWLDNNKKEYKDLLEQASIFVLVSESESFGMVIAEAMCAGCVIISSNVSGCVEIVGSDGFLVEAQNSSDLSEKIVFLINHTELMPEFSVKALEKSKRYDWSNVLNKTIEVYE